MTRIVLIAACVVLGLSLAIGGGPAPLGRVLLGAGLPGLAAPFLSQPGWAGVAAYRAGDLDRAAQAFRAAEAWLNLGNTETRRGNYAAALEAYDLARLAGDPRGAANFDLVTAFYAGLELDAATPLSWKTERDELGPTVRGPIGEGSARAASTGTDTTNAGTLLGLPELQSWAATSGTRRVFDDRFMVANERWLATLDDVPGAYLGARISFERKRRGALGLTPPDPEDPR